MIELTAQDGSPVTVNPATLWHVRAGSGDQTAIYSTSGAALFVRESYVEVRRALMDWDFNDGPCSGTSRVP